MDQREFEAVVDEFGADVQDLVELVETARYEQATAVEISRLLDAREDLLVLVNKLPALRAAEPPPASAARDARTVTRPSPRREPTTPTYLGTGLVPASAHAAVRAASSRSSFPNIAIQPC